MSSADSVPPGPPGLVIHGARTVDVLADRADGWLRIAGDRIATAGDGEGWRGEIRPGDEVVDATGCILVPGFVDMHCHGAAGATVADGRDGIRRVLDAHGAHGTTRLVLSLVSEPLPVAADQLTLIADVAEEDARLLGGHAEGPFLSIEHRGAHNRDLLAAPDRVAIADLVAAGRGTLRQLTLAPELPGASAAIADLVAAGVRAAVGHTSADYDVAMRAYAAGATILTHAFNGMPGIHHRAPGPVAAGIWSPTTTLEIIADGVHVHPAVVRLAFAAAPGRVALVTDAMAAACGPDGRYRLGSMDVDVVDGVARLSDGTSIAGSTLTMDAAVRNVVEWGVPLQDAVAAATHVPAAALGLDSTLGRLAPGWTADAVLLDADLHVLDAYVAGRRVTSS